MAEKIKDGSNLDVEAGNLNTEFRTNGTDAEASGSNPIIVKFGNGNTYTVDNSSNVEVKEPSITEYVKVGDYIDYDPTYSDAKKTTTVIKKDATDQNSGNFVLNGARGYLYAEQELNEVCKIYGYGYEADTSVGSNFKVGGPYSGEETTRTITGTGARSITVEDINKIAKVGETKDGTNVTTSFTDLDSSYGSITNPTSNVKYPTINTSLGDSTTGVSSSPGVKNLKYTYYSYNKSKITDTDIQNMLFNGNYRLASRCISSTGSSYANVGVRFVFSGDVRDFILCYGDSSRLNEYADSLCAVRPIVTLKSNVIDISNADENSGKDGYAWELK